jgi:hypothetical protein
MGELPFVKTRILLTPKEARVILNRVEELETLNKVLEGDKQQLLVAIEEAGNKTQKHIDDLEAALKLASTMLFDERSEIKFWQYLEDRGIELITES